MWLVCQSRFAYKSRIKVSKRSKYLEKLRYLPVGTKMHIRHYYDLKSKMTISQKGIKTVTRGLRISPTEVMQQMFKCQKVRGQTYYVPPHFKVRACPRTLSSYTRDSLLLFCIPLAINSYIRYVRNF